MCYFNSISIVLFTLIEFSRLAKLGNKFKSLQPATNRYKNHLGNWQKATVDYYDREFVLKAVTEGVTLGLDRPASELITTGVLAPNKSFYPFSKFQTNAITDWLIERLQKGTVAGPFDSEQDVGFPVYTVPIFTVPKPELGKYRIIQNFSHKYGKFSSINDHIKPENVALTYVAISELALVVYTGGVGAYMFIRDLDQAYYLLPLNPSEYPLMGFKWAGKLWIFKVAGMGVASSPRSFTRFVDP